MSGQKYFPHRYMPSNYKYEAGMKANKFESGKESVCKCESMRKHGLNPR